jgi:succinate-semialdehyde dehydrogenase/glutarate-semialdehyde dehydrogenase
MNSADVQKNLISRQKAFAEWKKTSFAHRGSLMLKVASIIRNNKEEYARTIAWKWANSCRKQRLKLKRVPRRVNTSRSTRRNFLKDQTMVTEAETKFCSLSTCRRPARHYALEFFPFGKYSDLRHLR